MTPSMAHKLLQDSRGKKIKTTPNWAATYLGWQDNTIAHGQGDVEKAGLLGNAALRNGSRLWLWKEQAFLRESYAWVYTTDSASWLNSWSLPRTMISDLHVQGPTKTPDAGQWSMDQGVWNLSPVTKAKCECLVATKHRWEQEKKCIIPSDLSYTKERKKSKPSRWIWFFMSFLRCFN